MHTLKRLYGCPHEFLHVIALLLIGRRPRAVSCEHTDIPDDLTRGQYTFVAAAPALVFGLLFVIGFGLLLRAEWIVGALLVIVGGFGVGGCMGDMQLILARWLEE